MVCSLLRGHIFRGSLSCLVVALLHKSLLTVSWKSSWRKVLPSKKPSVLLQFSSDFVSLWLQFYLG